MANCRACSSQNALHPVRALETIDVLDHASDTFLLYGLTTSSIIQSTPILLRSLLLSIFR
jgi:hypothetical protein